MANAWKEFEELVTRIEKLLAPPGAIVKTNDQVRDSITGRSRQVDGTIRYQTDKGSVLITIECRDRSGVEDVTWVEQMVTKRNDLGAAKTIGVSSRSFTGPMIKKAAHYGIELRTVGEITEEVIKGWLSSVDLANAVYDYQVKAIDVRLHDDGTGTQEPEMADAERQAFEKDPLVAPILIRPSDGVCTSLGRFLTFFLRMEPAFFMQIPPNGSTIERKFERQFSRDSIHVLTTTGPRDVEAIEFTLAVTGRMVTTSPTQIASYADPNESLVQFVVWNVQADGKVIGSVLAHHNIGTTQTRFDVSHRARPIDGLP